VSEISVGPWQSAGSVTTLTVSRPVRCCASHPEIPMNVMTLLLLIAMVATAGVLAVGLIGFFKGGEFNRKYGNKLMRARVALQAVAVLLLFAVLFTSG
jgi:hypothetical protein